MLLFSAIGIGVGFYFMLSGVAKEVYKPAALAVRRRAAKQASYFDVLIHRLATKILPLIDLDTWQKTRLETMLKSLGRSDTPELFQAKSIAKGILTAACLSIFILFFSPLITAAICGVAGYINYKSDESKMRREMEQRRRLIERELPQLASTICQNLNSTFDITTILKSYRKVCGVVLKDEITRTLNDMETGNAERALKSLESRISSPKLGQVIRGLLGVCRGDDQRVYFQTLASEFRASVREEVAKELLQRPKQLNPNMALMFGCIMLMVAASLGTYLIQSLSNLF